MKISDSKILVLAPHTDDGEFGCGGSISKFIEQKNDVYYVAFSICEKSVPKNLPSDILAKEVREATKVLGIQEDHLFILDYEVREFMRDRQLILEDIIKIKKKINPDIVLIPSLNDVHQDHRTIAEEGTRAFKFETILSYELPWNNISFSNSLFIHLEEKHINAKILALKRYESQFFRSYAKDDLPISQARFRGVQAGSKYAEVFEVVRINIA